MFVSRVLYIWKLLFSKAGFAKTIALICLAIRDSMLVTLHISANLVNSIAVVMARSRKDRFKKCISRSKKDSRFWKCVGRSRKCSSSRK